MNKLTLSLILILGLVGSSYSLTIREMHTTKEGKPYVLLSDGTYWMIEPKQEAIDDAEAAMDAECTVRISPFGKAGGVDMCFVYAKDNTVCIVAMQIKIKK